MYKDNIRLYDIVDAALAPAMGDYVYLAAFKTEEQLNCFYSDVTAEAEKAPAQEGSQSQKTENEHAAAPEQNTAPAQDSAAVKETVKASEA